MFYIKRLTSRMGIFLGALAVSAAVLGQTEPSKPDTWFLQTSMMTLDAGTRFVGGSVVSNTGSAPVYVRTSVEAVSIVGGERVRAVVPNGALRVYPEEFVLRPGDAFTARLVADPTQMSGDSQSFYVKFSDVSNTHPDSKSSAGMQNGFLLAFEALVSVNKKTSSKLTSTDFALTREGNKHALINKSGRHVYLDRGNACPESKPMLVDCKDIPEFPRQSLLPGEAVSFAAVDDVFLGIMVFAGLNPRDRAEILYIPTAEFGTKAKLPEAAGVLTTLPVLMSVDSPAQEPQLVKRASSDDAASTSQEIPALSPEPSSLFTY